MRIRPSWQHTLLLDANLMVLISVMASMLSCANAGSSTTEALGAILTDSQPSKHARRLAHAVTNVCISNNYDLSCSNIRKITACHFE
jgi:hypothetical protein